MSTARRCVGHSNRPALAMPWVPRCELVSVHAVTFLGFGTIDHRMQVPNDAKSPAPRPGCTHPSECMHTPAAPPGPSDELPKISVILPVLNSMRTLPQCLRSILAAAARYRAIELIVVDNGSTDSSCEFAAAIPWPETILLQRPRLTVPALRNEGAALAHGDLLSFIDSDCAVPPDYFYTAVRSLHETGAAATGCMYALPPNPGWIEEVWHRLHAHQRDGLVQYLNAGNFLIWASIFRAAGGFDARLITGEDAELGQRLNSFGYRIFECHAVRAEHLGNPKTLRAFYKKQAWHGLGMFGTFRVWPPDRPTYMTLLHLLLCMLAASIAILLPFQAIYAIPVALCLICAVPAATVIYRIVQGRTAYKPLAGIMLYALYYSARISALVKMAFRPFATKQASTST